jgi:23S rRNA pseudouridine955/2504/2580 synthase
VGKTPLPELQRNFLHAARLGFVHPRTGVPLEFRAPLPPELRSYLEELAGAAGEDPARIDAVVRPYL